LCAGVSLSLTVYYVLTDDFTLWTVWQGASFAAEDLPNLWVLRAAGVLVAVLVWIVASLFVKSPGGLPESLLRVAPGFSGFLSVLALNAADAYRGGETMHWSVLATTCSAGFLAAWITVLAAGDRPAALETPKSASGRAAITAILLGAAVYFAVTFTMGMLQYRALRISCEDTAEFDEMLWRTLHGSFLASSRYGPSFFAKHFEFIQVFLLPLYAIWPGLPLLMLTQGAALASGVIPVYLLARRKLDNRAAAALFSLGYLAYAPMQYADKRLIYGTYLPETLAIPALLWALYFFDRGRMRWFLAAGFFAAASKEDMVLPVAMMGLVLAFRGKWRWGMPVFVGGVAWFIVALTVIVPHYAGGPSHTLMSFAQMGGSVGGVLKTVFGDPLYALRFALEFKRADFMLMILAPMGCLALFSPTAVLIFLPSIASNLLASWEPSTTIYYHYHISLVPFAVGGAVLGAANLVRILPQWAVLWGRVVPERRAGCVALFCGVFVLASSVGGDIVYGKMPWSLKFYNPASPAYWRHIYVEAPRAEFFVSTVLPSIPPSAKVSASQFLATRFTHQAAAHVYPRGLGEADYIVLEKDEPDQFSYSYNVSSVGNAGARIDGFELILDESDICVYRREANAPTSSREKEAPG